MGQKVCWVHFPMTEKKEEEEKEEKEEDTIPTGCFKISKLFSPRET